MSGSCLVQLPKSFIPSLFKGCTEVVQRGPVESKCVDFYLHLLFNSLISKRGTATEPVCSFRWWLMLASKWLDSWALALVVSLTSTSLIIHPASVYVYIHYQPGCNPQKQAVHNIHHMLNTLHDDFESMAPTNNWHDDQFPSQNDHVTGKTFTNNSILVIWSWPSSSSRVDSYTITEMICKSIYWLDQLLQDVQEPGWDRDQRGEFLKQWRPCCTRHTRFESFIGFWCNPVRMD